MDGHLAFHLHALTGRLDRMADRILRAEYHLSYRRFLVLFMTGRLTAPSQRTLADHLGVTEPSVSRMIAALSAAGLLDPRPDPAGGNRRGLHLTTAGQTLVRQCCDLLEDRMTELVETSGVPYATYLAYTNQLLASPHLA